MNKKMMGYTLLRGTPSYPANQNRYLWMQMSKFGYRRQEPIEIALEHPSLLNELIEAHFNDLEYSEEELAKALKLNPDEFQEMYLNDNSHPHIKIVK
jgi:hypothetical protein